MTAEMDILGTKIYIWEKNPNILSEIKGLYFFLWYPLTPWKKWSSIFPVNKKYKVAI